MNNFIEKVRGKTIEFKAGGFHYNLGPFIPETVDEKGILHGYHLNEKGEKTPSFWFAFWGNETCFEDSHWKFVKNTKQEK